MKNEIQISAAINSTIKNVWKHFIQEDSIIKWSFASEDWHCPSAKNDFSEGGKFSYHMAAKDGSFAFDMKGKFDKIIEGKKIDYSLEDGRKVSTEFIQLGDQIKVIQTFEAENKNSKVMQKAGWQAILNNFKTFVETNQY